MRSEDITYRVISLDPGANLGITVSEGDLGMTYIKPLHTETVDLNKWVARSCPDLAATFGSRFARIYALRQVLSNVFRKWQPDFMANENAFMMIRRVTAGIILAEYVLVMKMVAYEYDPALPIYGYAPFEIKASVKTKKLSGQKTLVTDALPLLADLDLTNVDITKLDEHSIDSIAIGYCFLHKNRKGNKK